MEFLGKLAQAAAAALAAALSNLTGNQLQLQPSPSPSLPPSIAEIQPTPTNDDNLYIANGTVEGYENYKVNYTFTIPKQGGAITGAYTGSCNGPVEGTYQPNSSPEVTGNLTGKCELGIFKLDIKGSYTGNLDETNKTLTINYQTTSPLNNSGSKSIDLKD